MHGSTLGFSLDPLYPQLVIPKPIESAPDSLFQQLEDEDRLTIQWKRNGNGTVVPVTSNRVGLYSRSINEWTPNFPDHVEELRSMNIPNESLLTGEMVLRVKGVDSPTAFGRLARSNRAASLELQKEFGPPQLAFFDIIVRKGKLVIGEPHQNRLEMIQEITAKHSGGNVGIIDVLKMSFDKAKAHSLKQKWEGLVLYDKLAGSGIRLDGKSEQPIRQGSWKWKKYKEGDFVAIGWRPSTSGRYAGLVKDFILIQYHPDTGEVIPRGHVGGGLSGKQKAEFAKDSCYPLVVEVEYEYLTDNGKVYNGHILRIRDDKRPHECVAPRQ